MKNFILAFCLLLGGAVGLSAQDIITTREGEDIEARILEVSGDEVKYKRFNYPDGPDFVMPKSKILIICYENGDTAIFSNQESSYPDYRLYANGPVVPGMSYRDYKDFYDTGFYCPEPDDPYSRFWTGAASFLIPGLGEAIEGEWLRGLCFCASNVALYAIQRSNAVYDGTGAVVDANSFYWTAFFARVALNIWSICDAVHIAKVKNMYYQDITRMRSSLDFKLEPYFAYSPSDANNLRPAAGLSLKLSF